MAQCFDLPLYRNPLRTRQDVADAVKQLVEPASAYATAGNAGFRLGDFSALYSSDAARVEAFSRILWGLGPLWADGRETAYFDRFREGLVNGADPDHPAYWGVVTHKDQKIVEMAAIALLLLLCGDRLALNEKEARNLHAWLAQVNRREIPLNNWLFFRLLVNAAFRRMGWEWDENRVKQDFELVDSYYLGDGWYFDGQPGQIDYYIPMGFHYYGLIYAHFMEELEPERCRILKDRAGQFAKDYLYWFQENGEALPFGRSLTYRFAQSAFFSALALAGVETIPYGVMKAMVLGNLRYWFRRSILDARGLLTVGYAYPNLIASENYNAPGSPYWGCKVFLCLALPEDHPFWTCPEEAPVLDKQKLLKKAGMIFCRDEKQVQMFPAGRYCGNEMGSMAAKYEKLCYSTSFGFSVPRGGSLEEGAFDNCMAFSEDGENFYRMQRNFESCEVTETGFRRTFSPLRGVKVTVTVTPDFPSHTREYTITTDRPIDAADGGFAIPAEMEGVSYSDAMVSVTERAVTARFPWGVSSIACLEGNGSPALIWAFPNTNLLHPNTRIPTIRFHLEPGVHHIVTKVIGDLL